MNKIWMLRGMDIDKYSWLVGLYLTEEKAFEKKAICEKEAEEEGFEDWFTVSGPHHPE